MVIPDHPSIPNLEGAVDLSSPVQICLNQFKQTMAQGGGMAVVIVGQTADGNVALSYHSPGGTVQALGLLGMATAMLGQSARPSQ